MVQKISILSFQQQKFSSILWNITLVGRGKTFPVGLHQVCTYCSWCFGPFFKKDLFKSCDALGLSIGNRDYQLPLQIFYWIGVWKLAWPLESVCCPGGVFGIYVMLEDPAMSHPQCSQWWKDGLPKISWYMTTFNLSLTWISRLVSFAEKQPKSIIFPPPPPCITKGMVLLGCNSAFPFQTRQVVPKSYILVSFDQITWSQSPSG